MPRKTAVAAAEPPKRKRAPRKATTQAVQAAVEGVEVVDDPRKVEFLGQYFLMAEKIGLMPLLKFAHASSRGLDSGDMEGLAAMYAMIYDCIDQTVPTERRIDPTDGVEKDMPVGSSEYQRFERHALEQKADADDLMKLVQTVIERLSARPSRPPGDSPAGRLPTSQNSKAISSGPEYPGLQGVEGMTSVADLDRLT